MERTAWIAATCSSALLSICTSAVGNSGTENAGSFVFPADSSQIGTAVPKAASAQTLGARGFVTSLTPLYGAFELRSSTVVYLIVRGNSLGALGITQDYLDAPRVRIYNRLGTDLVSDTSGRVGFNGCSSSNTFAAPVRNFYAFTRAAPASDRDACFAQTFPAGVYTFSVTPSIPGVTSNTTTSSPPAGEVLFEVTFNP